ncbi:hypothetical protein SAMN05216259_11279 [Actinacidiphila guanduensis]|uniref:Uncharacterized protein n=1 Tax=Actinacidiphila guanduensis TaxID=310781 RepID=A0A1H0M630_9ACTN|nr:hypothetical protein SAMN05216259_11279 [Actinacidiphila guanduensis]
MPSHGPTPPASRRDAVSTRPGRFAPMAYAAVGRHQEEAR